MFSDTAPISCKRSPVTGLDSKCRVPGLKARCPIEQEDGAMETRRTALRGSCQFFPIASVGISRGKPTSPPVGYLRAGLSDRTRLKPGCSVSDRLWWTGGSGDSGNRITEHRLSNTARGDRCVRRATCSETCSTTAAMPSGGVVNGAPVPLLSTICESRDVS
jgi:hypothetical protein